MRAITSGILLLIGLLTAATGGCERRSPAAQPANASPPRLVELWQPWGNIDKEALESIIDEFQRCHPGIRVKMSFAANNLTSSQKLFLAIAGGCAPDVTFVDGQQLAEWAARGALMDLTDQVKQAGLSADDFWLPRWQESTFDGRVYALPFAADPNFALIWNKQLFREAGLDPDRPPRTIDELDDYSRKLTRFDSKGRVLCMGFIPWQWGGDNSIFTWGYAFGGDFYRRPPPGQRIGQVTANDPKIAAAMRWMAGYARAYDVRSVAAFQANFVGASNNPFYLNKLAMSLIHVVQLQYIKLYAPTIEYGIGFIPAPPGGEHPTGWIGGWSLGVPRGKPVTPEAFELIRWICASPQGTLAVGRKMNLFPAFRSSPYFDQIRNDPERSVFYQIVRNARHVRTLMPVQGYLMDLLRRGTDQVLYGQRDPQEVLDEITARAQQRLEEVMKQKG